MYEWTRFSSVVTGCLNSWHLVWFKIHVTFCHGPVYTDMPYWPWLVSPGASPFTVFPQPQCPEPRLSSARGRAWSCLLSGPQPYIVGTCLLDVPVRSIRQPCLQPCLWPHPLFLLAGCPGFGQHRVNFHQNPGRGTAGWADPAPTWPSRAGYSIPCAVTLGSGGRGGRHGGNSRGSGERALILSGREGLLCEFVSCFLLICIFVVPVPSVCCSVKLPLSRPTSFCLFSFLSPPHRGGGRGGRVALLLPAVAQTKTYWIIIEVLIVIYLYKTFEFQTYFILKLITSGYDFRKV